MNKMYSVKVKSHDQGPDCEECGKPMSNVELIDKIPNAISNVAYVCFRCTDGEKESGE